MQMDQVWSYVTKNCRFSPSFFLFKIIITQDFCKYGTTPKFSQPSALLYLVGTSVSQAPLLTGYEFEQTNTICLSPGVIIVNFFFYSWRESIIL